MAKRQKEWARRERTRIMAILGNVCAECGSTDSLEFDCIFPQGDKHHKLATDSRMCFYRVQLARENLQLLCTDCNSEKSLRDKLLLQGTLDPHHLPSPARENNPF